MDEQIHAVHHHSSHDVEGPPALFSGIGACASYSPPILCTSQQDLEHLCFLDYNRMNTAVFTSLVLNTHHTVCAAVGAPAIDKLYHRVLAL